MLSSRKNALKKCNYLYFYRFTTPRVNWFVDVMELNDLNKITSSWALTLEMRIIVCTDRVSILSQINATTSCITCGPIFSDPPSLFVLCIYCAGLARIDRLTQTYRCRQVYLQPCDGLRTKRLDPYSMCRLLTSH